MFTGSYSLNIDEKGRFAVPAKFRQGLQDLCGGKLMLTLADEGCLFIRTYPAWLGFAQKIHDLPDSDPRARAVKRLIASRTQEVEMDKQGRVNIPPGLRERTEPPLKPKSSVMLVGAFDKFELWGESAWEGDSEAGLAGYDPEYVASLGI